VHRDGSRLGLSPFQSEIRRRLWWHLLTRDGRAGEDYGLQSTLDLIKTNDVRIPLNIDDKDLSPEMSELPPERRGWTAMTFDLINIELVRAMQELSTLAIATSTPGEDVRKTVVAQTKERIHEYLKSCNSVIPQQRMTIVYSSWLIRKLDFVTRLQWSLLQPRNNLRSEDFATEENLREALELLQLRFDDEDELLRPYAWMRTAYPQYHTTMYILWHLCVDPDGPSTDRAWCIVEKLFLTEHWHKMASGYGPKSAVLEALKLKALSLKRDSRNQANSVASTWTSSGEPAIHAARAHGDGAEDAVGDGGNLRDWAPTGCTFENTSDGLNDSSFDISVENDAWPDWTILAQGYEFEGPGTFPGHH
jgi:hypothetical protein